MRTKDLINKIQKETEKLHYDIINQKVTEQEYNNSLKTSPVRQHDESALINFNNSTLANYKPPHLQM